MNQLNNQNKYFLVIILLMMAMSSFAQKQTGNTNTNNTLGGNGGTIQASGFGQNDDATSTNSQSDKGTPNPLGFAINPNNIHNTGSINQGSGGNTGNSSSIQTCPLLYTHVDIPFLQSCLYSTARVSYCNQGNATAYNAYIDVELEADLLLDSTSIPYTALGAQMYRFQLGTIADSLCDEFDIHFTTTCDTSLF